MIPHGTPSGYSYHKCKCDICATAKKQRDREYYLANAEKRKAKARQYYAENQVKAAASQKRYREENAEVLKAKSAEYTKANSARLTAKSAQWAKDNPERYKQQRANYRKAHKEELRQKSLDRYYSIMATNPERIRKLRRDYAKTPYGRAIYYSAQNLRRRGAPYTPEAIEWMASIDWATTFCTYCEDALAVEIDHIVPMTKGGTGERINLTPVCRSCNARKGDMYLAEFLGFVEPERISVNA